MECSGSRKAQDLLSQIKNIIEEHESTIAAQSAQIKKLESQVANMTQARDALLTRIHQLEKNDVHPNGKKHHKQSSSPDKSKRIATTNHNQNSNGPTSATMLSGSLERNLSSASVERSSSFQRKHLEEQDAKAWHNGYELSSDIRDRQVELTRKRYGGAEKCEHAARVIQEAYRNYRMRVNFKKIRRSKTRRLTIDNIPATVSALRRQSPSKTALNHSQGTDETVNNVDVVEIVLEHSFSDSNQQSSHEENKNGTDETTHENKTEEPNSSESNKDETLTNDKGVLDNTHAEFTVAQKAPSPKRNSDGSVSQDELIRNILEDAPETLNFVPTRRRRHGYETMILPSQLPSTPEHSTPTIDSSVHLRRRSNQLALSSRNSDGELGVRRHSSGWIRTNSELSLVSVENEGDLESARSSDTASINSELSSNIGDGLQGGYLRRSTLSIQSSCNSEISNDATRKRLYRIGLNLFNKKPSKGLNFLIGNMFVEDSPPAVAAFLFNRKGLSRQMVGEYLGNTQKVFNQEVLESVCELMDFSGLELDEALRSFQAQIKVQGEAQKVERLVEAFSQRYCTCNPKIVQNLRNPDSMFILSFAIIMLNTDLHSPNMKHEKRMTEQDFIKNLRGIDNGGDLNEEMLKNVYNRIKQRELVTLDDHLTQVLQVENSIVGKKPILAVPHRRLVCLCRLYQVTDPTKPQKPGVHQREIFLFNDLIVVVKILQKKKSGTNFSFRQSLSLHGLTYLTFDTTYYRYGIRLINSIDNKVLITFNAPNEHDRTKFVNDVKECISEVQEMENLRIGAELEKAQAKSPTEVRSSNLLNTDLKKLSTSMHNLNDSHFSLKPFAGHLRPTSMYDIPGNENNNNNKVEIVVNELGVISPTDKSPTRNAPRIPVIGTFFGSSTKIGGLKRGSRTSGKYCFHSNQNGGSPNFPFTPHEV